VQRFHGSRFPDAPLVVIEPGEDSKDLHTVRTIYERCVELELDRGALVVGIGGGVVCDIAGFVGATYLRGVDFGFVATSLLAQVDASVGGKNGVNLNSYKNLVGTFAQPEFVVVDHQLLKTLPEIELRSGLAEVVKAAAIADEKLFDFIEQHQADLLAADQTAIAAATKGAVEVKADIVMKDERESNLRRLLNFGHTFGHAVERTSGLTHGEAVSVGMVVAARLSSARGLITTNDVDRIEAMLDGLGLPIRIAADGDLAFDAMRKDKKREGDSIYFVLLEKIGSATITPISLDELKGVINDLCGDH
jgi:3-dehydroquinate synthase